jgi:PAS domain S-box-containing protein
MANQDSQAGVGASSARVQVADLELENELEVRARVALETANQESAVLFEHAPVGFFVLDSGGTVRRVNRRGAESLGLASNDVLDVPFVNFVTEPSAELFGWHLYSTLSCKRGEMSDLLMCRAGGGTFWVRARSEFTPASRTAGEGVFLIIDEIDDLKEIPREVGTSAEKRSSIQDKPSGIRGRVLVIDDEELILNATSRILTRMGYEVIGFSDPDAALAGFEAEPGAFDAIITDFRMPTMNGLQLSERLVEKREDVPILLMSGFTGEIDIERAREIGIRRVASKPLSYAELAIWLEDAIDGADLT